MDTDIKFLNPNKISIEFTKEKIIEIAKENNLILDIQDKPSSFDTYQGGCIEFSLSKNTNYDSMLLHARILCESFKDTWFLTKDDYNPKKHFGEECYYILSFINLGGDGYDVSFMLHFAIFLLEKIPNTIVETLEGNPITMFEEYNLNELYLIKSENYINNWKELKEK